MGGVSPHQGVFSLTYIHEHDYQHIKNYNFFIENQYNSRVKVDNTVR